MLSYILIIRHSKTRQVIAKEEFRFKSERQANKHIKCFTSYLDQFDLELEVLR
jgi:hypothetical protein